MSLKILYPFLFLISFTSSFFSQNETKKWFFGNGAGLDFSSSSPTVITGGAITTSVGCASIANSSGNLQFYTDGVTVYNQLHAVMANGTGLLGNNAAQSAIILKKPGSTNIYYIFTVQGNNGSAGLNYSVVDMSLASGNGSVTVKNVSLYAGACFEKLSATKHCNGTDSWVLAVCGGVFRSFSVTASGVSTTPVISSTLPGGGVSGGCMKLSPNGRKLLAAWHGSMAVNQYLTSAMLYDYDNLTGLVTNSVVIWPGGSYIANLTYHSYGCEFSPNGTKAYFNFGSIIQYDLCSPTPSNALSNVNLNESSTTESAIKRSFQLGPDGKIYIATSSNSTLYVPTNSLGVINSPNSTGNSANYNNVGVSLGTYSCMWGLPNFPGSFFEQKPTPNFSYSANSDISCLTNTFYASQVCASTGYSVSGYQWDFGEPASGSANTSFLMNPIHNYAATGTYSVKLIRSFNCFTDTVIKFIHVTSPSLSVLSQSMGCGVNSATATIIGGTGPYSYSWSPGSQTTAVTSVSNTSGIYTISVSDNGGGCAVTTTAYIANTILNVSVSSTAPLCYGYATASASVTTNGGSGSYTYTWMPGLQTTTSITNSLAGSYTVTVFDQLNHCNLTKTLVISQPSPFNIGFSSGLPACAGNTVILSANASGGTPNYQYTWLGGPTTDSYMINPSLPGTYIYTCSTKDFNNCTSTGTIAVNVSPYPVLTVYSTSLCVSATGIISVSGGNSYTWQPGSYVGTNYTVSPLATTIYTVSSDSLGCVTTSTAKVSVFPNPSATISANGPLCVGQTLLLSCFSSGGSIYWNGPNGFTSALQNPTITPLSQLNSGTYSLMITNSYGCSSSATSSVSVFANPIVSVSGNTMICLGQNATLTALGAANYNWNNGINGPQIVVSPTINTNYSVTGLQSAAGCSDTKTLTVKVSECLGVIERDDNSFELDVYPNPGSGTINIQIKSCARIQIISLLGKVMLEDSLNSGVNPFDLSNFGEGVYTLIVRDGQTIYTRKFILQ